MAEDSSATGDYDFADQMNELAREVDSPKSARASEARTKADRTEVLMGVGELVRPLADALDVIKRASSDNNALLTALGKTLNGQRAIPQSLEAMAEQMQRLGKVESANQRMFDTLHGELKSYKDNFLFDALQKPFIRDLVALFDDFTAVHAQIDERLLGLRENPPAAGDELPFLERVHGNLENNVHHMLEVFLRMDVTIVRTPVGAPLDKKIHRTMAVSPAASPADDSLIEQSVKPGFFWHDRTVRAEEVVVRRWTAPDPSAPAAEAVETVLITPPESDHLADLKS